MLSVSLEFTPSQFLMGSMLVIFLFGLELVTNVFCVSWVHAFTVVDGIHAAYRLYFVLSCSPMLSVSLEFTPSQFLMGSMLVIFFFGLELFTNVVCVSWVHTFTVFDGIHAGYLFYLVLSCSPMLSVSLEFTPSQFWWDPCCLSFVFGLELFTNVVCVSRVHTFTVFDGIHAVYRLYLVLSCSPMLSVSLDFILGLK